MDQEIFVWWARNDQRAGSLTSLFYVLVSLLTYQSRRILESIFLKECAELCLSTNVVVVIILLG